MSSRIRISLFRRALRNPEYLAALLRASPERRLFWSLHPTPTSQRGFWERNAHGRWVAQAEKYVRRSGSVARGEAYLNKKYVKSYRVDFYLFNRLLELLRPSLTFENTHLRRSICPAKRLAILLHWLVETQLA